LKHPIERKKNGRRSSKNIGDSRGPVVDHPYRKGRWGFGVFFNNQKEKP